MGVQWVRYTTGALPLPSKSNIQMSEDVMTLATLTIDDVQLSLGHRALRAVVSALVSPEYDVSDPTLLRKLIARLCEHADPSIRALVAKADNLPFTVVDRLVGDQSPLVVLSYVDCGNEMGHVLPQHVAKWLHWHCPQLHLALANQIGNFNPACRELIFRELGESPDTSIREALAENWELPKEFLEQLAQDSDSDVAACAKETLSCQVLDDDRDSDEE